MRSRLRMERTAPPADVRHPSYTDPAQFRAGGGRVGPVAAGAATSPASWGPVTWPERGVRMCYEVRCGSCGELVDVEFWEEHLGRCGRTPKDKVPADAPEAPAPLKAQA